jgi:hypothetical protein
LIDEAEQDCGAEVFGAERAGAESGQDIEGGGFAAAAGGGAEVESRGNVENLVCMSVAGPESKGVGRAVGKEEVKGMAFGDGGENGADIADRFRPGDDFGEVEGVGFDVELGADAGDFKVEGGDADAESLGLGLTEAIVFGGREFGQAEEGGGVGVGRGRVERGSIGG